MHNCQYLLACSNDPINGMQTTYCDRPASIKRQGIWLCTEHYDEIEGGSSRPLVTPKKGYIYRQGTTGMDEIDPETRKLAKNRLFSIMYGGTGALPRL